MESGRTDTLWYTADRRHSRRHNASIAARVSIIEGLSWPCQVMGFSATGVLVRYPVSRAAALRSWLDADDGNRINLHIGSGQAAGWHCIPGYTVRADNGTLAIQFPSASLQVLEILLLQAGLVDSGDSRCQERPSSDAALSQIRTHWLEGVGHLFEAWINALPSGLMPPSTGLREVLTSGLQALFDGVSDTGSPAHAGTDWLILGVLGERARQRHEAGVGSLHARLAGLGLESAQSEPGPLGPDVLCCVLGQAVRMRGLNREESRALYMRFESDVLQELGFVYSELHSVLTRDSTSDEAKQQGMLLHLPASPRRSVSNRRREAEIAVRQVAMPPLPSLTEPEDLRPEPLDGRTRLEAIRSLYSKLENGPARVGGRRFPESLVPTLGDALCRSPRLTERGRQLIRRLEPVIARALAGDPDSLEASAQPLKRLLNRIGHLDTADHHRDIPWPDGIYRPLRGIDPEDSPNQALLQASDAVQRELQEREAVYRRQVHTAIKAVAGSERMNEAARVTDEALDDRLSGEPVPRPVLHFVEGEWRNLMMLHYLRSESQEGEWSEALELLDGVLDASAGAATADTDELMARIRAFCARTPEQADEESLEQLAEHLRNPERSRYVKLSLGFRREPRGSQELTGDSTDQAVPYWKKSLETMPVGTWFLEKRSDGTTRPIRLAWASQHRRRFLLVGPLGRKIADPTSDVMAQWLSDGTLLPISRYDQTLTDEALDRLLETLYRRLIERVITDPETDLCNEGEFRRRLARMLVTSPPCREHTLIIFSWRVQSVEPRTLVQLLSQQLPPQSLLGRLSGHRLALLFHGRNVETWLMRMLRRMNRVIAGEQGAGEQGVLRAGVVMSDPAIVTAERWLNLASKACERAPYEWPPAFRHGSVSAERIRHVVRLADRLAGNQALRRNELMLRASRIIPLHGSTRMPAQHEMSMTVPDEHGELMDASELIPLAQRYGGGHRLDDWLMQAVQECLGRPLKMFPEAESGICIPVLGHTLTESGLTRFIRDVLHNNRYPVNKLWFCVSEADAVAHPNAVALFMRAVRDMGGRICLDMRETDVNMARLVWRLPVDLIRVADGRDLQRGEHERNTTLSAVVTVAHQLGAEVVVNGVANAYRIDALRTLGVDYAQGPAVGRPRLLPY